MSGGRAAAGLCAVAFVVGSLLSLRLGRGGWRVVYVRRCGFGGAISTRFTSGVAVLLWRFVLGSRLLFDALRQTGRLAISCVPVPPGRDRHSCVLAVSVRLSAFVGSLRACTFLCGDLDGLPEYGRTGEREDGATGLAARPLCAFAQAHRLCNSFRGEYVGAPRPKPAPKSLRLSGLSSRCGGAALVRIRAVTRVHGKTRPTLIYGRAGRAV